MNESSSLPFPNPAIRPIIAPSVLAADFAFLSSECDRMLKAGADWLHLDIMDGHFVGNISFGPPVVAALRRSCPSAFFDVHLMVAHPAQWIEPFHEAGVNQVTFHWEAADASTATSLKIAELIGNKGMKVGLSIKPNTAVEDVFDVLDSGRISTLLIMTVEPGFGGQKFMSEMMPKVKTARRRYPELIIEVDGGLNLETAEEAAESGANALVAGTSLYRATDPGEAITKMKESVRKHLPHFASS